MACKINLTTTKHLFGVEKEEARSIRNFLKVITDGMNDGVDWENVSDIHIYPGGGYGVHMEVTVIDTSGK